MSHPQSAALGSGTIPYLNPILHTSLGGTASELPTGAGPGQGRGVRTGSQVIVANPEDLNSAPAFAASGINVGTSAVEIWSPDAHESLLRRRRTIVIQNLGAGDVYLGHTSAVSTTVGGPEPGYQLPAPGTDPANLSASIALPLMGGVSVWAIGSAAADVRVLVY